MWENAGNDPSKMLHRSILHVPFIIYWIKLSTNRTNPWNTNATANSWAFVVGSSLEWAERWFTILQSSSPELVENFSLILRMCVYSLNDLPLFTVQWVCFSPVRWPQVNISISLQLAIWIVLIARFIIVTTWNLRLCVKFLEYFFFNLDPFWRKMKYVLFSNKLWWKWLITFLYFSGNQSLQFTCSVCVSLQSSIGHWTSFYIELNKKKCLHSSEFSNKIWKKNPFQC